MTSMNTHSEDKTGRGIAAPPIASPYDPDHKNYLSAEYAKSLEDPAQRPYSKSKRAFAALIAGIILTSMVIATLTGHLYLPSKRSGLVLISGSSAWGIIIAFVIMFVGYLRRVYSPKPATRPWSALDAGLIILGAFLFVALPIWLPRWF
jgi:hypothetical protein